MIRPSYFISASCEVMDKLAADLVARIRSLHSRHEVVGLPRKSMQQSRVSDLDCSELSGWLIGERELASDLSDLFDDVSFQLAIFVGVSQQHFELAKFFKTRGVYTVLLGLDFDSLDVDQNFLQQNFDDIFGFVPEIFFTHLNPKYRFIGCKEYDYANRLSISRSDLGIDHKEGLVSLSLGSSLEGALGRLSLLSLLEKEFKSLSYPILILVSLASDWLSDSRVCKALTENFTIDLESLKEGHFTIKDSVGFCVDMEQELIAIADFAVTCEGSSSLKAAFINTPSASYHLGEEKCYVNLLTQSDAVVEFNSQHTVSDIAKHVISELEGCSHSSQNPKLSELRAKFIEIGSPVEKCAHFVSTWLTENKNSKSSKSVNSA